jgi:hypothetical protein
LFLRSDHMFERGAELVREPSMRNDDDADHIAPRTGPRLRGRIFAAPKRGRKPEGVSVI